MARLSNEGYEIKKKTRIGYQGMSFTMNLYLITTAFSKN